jgi:NADH:ubiquinone oxidoreductase subunit 4 (subunit M)
LRKLMDKRDKDGYGLKIGSWYFARLSKKLFEFKNQNLAEYSKNYSMQLDIDYKDFYILLILTFLVFFTGVYSTFILDYITINSTAIVTHSISQLQWIN